MENKQYVYTVQFLYQKDGKWNVTFVTGDLDYLDRVAHQLSEDSDSVCALYTSSILIGANQPFVIKSVEADKKEDKQ